MHRMNRKKKIDRQIFTDHFSIQYTDEINRRESILRFVCVRVCFFRPSNLFICFRYRICKEYPGEKQAESVGEKTKNKSWYE